jgi:hypothetical protein
MSSIPRLNSIVTQLTEHNQTLMREKSVVLTKRATRISLKQVSLPTTVTSSNVLGTEVEYFSKKKKWVSGHITRKDDSTDGCFYVQHLNDVELSINLVRIRLIRGSKMSIRLAAGADTVCPQEYHTLVCSGAETELKGRNTIYTMGSARDILHGNGGHAIDDVKIGLGQMMFLTSAIVNASNLKIVESSVHELFAVVSAKDIANSSLSNLIALPVMTTNGKSVRVQLMI